jgi:FkbM family methyltransferase
MWIYPGREKFYWTGLHEPEVQDSLQDLLRPGMTVWDIGGHIGFMAMMAARQVGPTGRVHVFEPHPENRARLQANLELNGLKNVTIHPEAVAGKPGIAQFHRHQSSLMWTLMEDRGETEGLSVECVTLDNLLEKIGSPDLIKVDVEGAEVEVLQGGPNLLMNHSPQLVVEFSDEEMYDKGRDVVTAYSFQRIASRHWVLTKAPEATAAA